MKLALVLAGIVSVASGVFAQDFVAPERKTREIVTDLPNKQPAVSIEGIVKEIFDVKKPWQVVSPVAPASLGSGERFVSKDEGPATPHHSKGLIVLGIEW